MNLEKVVGVRCEIKGRGFAPDEKLVSIGDEEYCVSKSNIKRNKSGAYVEVLRVLESGRKFLVGINANGEWTNIYVKRGDLVSA